jgi:hypothetical protein
MIRIQMISMELQSDYASIAACGAPSTEGSVNFLFFRVHYLVSGARIFTFPDMDGSLSS